METKRRIRMVMAVCTLLAGLSGAAPGKIIYVDDDAAGANDGSSWANAFVRLQLAIALAEAGDEIRVAQGLYKPDPYWSIPPAGREPRGGSVEVAPKTTASTSFRLTGGVAIRGGFAGVGAEDPDARDFERYGTVLSGDLNGDDIAAWGLGHLIYESSRDDNSLFVVESTSRTVGSTTVLDGFTIEAATQSGFYNLGGDAQIVHCTFRQNSGLMFSGGAVHCEGGAPTFSHCVFEDNAAVVAGGAIHFAGARATLSDCRFLHNWAMSPGGAISSTNSDLILTDCTFTENEGRQGGAIHHRQGSLTLTDCRFEGNMAGEGGGAINLTQQIAASMTRCVFRENRATSGAGALYSDGYSVLLDKCIFSGNRATWGGAMYLHGPNPLGPDPLGRGTNLTRCILAGNCADRAGGALWADRAELTVNGCTFARNKARDAGTLGWVAGREGEIVCRVAMENCIIWDSSDPIPSELPGLRPTSGQEAARAEVVIEYSDVQGGWPGEGNIDADPLFARLGDWADAANPEVAVEPGHPNATWVDGDYHLKSQAGRWDAASESWVMDEVTSPCIDAGDPNTPIGDEPEPNGERVNMGAYGGTAEASKSL